MPTIYDRVSGREKILSDGQARELRASSPGRYTDDLRTPISDADWGAMTSSERGAAAMTRDHLLKTGKLLQP